MNELIGVMDDHTSLPERHLVRKRQVQGLNLRPCSSQLKLWLKPREFSTIAHITEAVKQREEQKSSSPAIEGSVVIKRRGVVVGPSKARFGQVAFSGWAPSSFVPRFILVNKRRCSRAVSIIRWLRCSLLLQLPLQQFKTQTVCYNNSE